MNAKAFCSPTLLSENHEIVQFSSEEQTLDDWLKERALANMKSFASRTYVICPTNSLQVIGYYSLCMGQIVSTDVQGSMRRNMPRQIPAVILGRLAIDIKWQGKGLGGALLQDAVQRSVRTAQEISARLLIVHVLSVQAESFYAHYGFARLPTETPTYALDLVKMQAFAPN
jgi:predicted GNAT family N-acyltransferase